jgi:RNA polymerase sigma-70 factor (ECF subfamily)
MAVRADDVDLKRDRDLVERYQAGDAGAFDELYRRYFDRLHLYCERRVGDRHVAEELAQEAFTRALRAMPRFAGERRFYPWMTVIAQRLCIDHHRRRSRVEPAAEIDLGSVDPEHDERADPIDLDQLTRALDSLAPRHREILELRERDGLTYLEIAQRLDVPVSTVEALLHRARKSLRRAFAS